MSKNDPLILAENAFQQWRHSRSHRCAKTPLALRKQAVALLEFHSRAIITSTLKLSGNNFKNWTEAFSPSSVSHDVSFVALEPLTTQPAALNLTLDMANGCQLRLSGDISPALLIALTQGARA